MTRIAATLALLALALVALHRFRRDVRAMEALMDDDDWMSERRSVPGIRWGISGPHFTSNTGEDQFVPMAAHPPVAAWRN